MDSVINWMVFLNEHWISVLVLIFLAIGIWKKTKDFMGKSEEEKKQIANEEIKNIKKQIMEVMLGLTSEEEIKYSEWIKAGAIKRAEVIKKVYEMYPALGTVANQDEIIAFIDEQIDEALKTLRKIIQEQTEGKE